MRRWHCAESLYWEVTCCCGIIIDHTVCELFNCFPDVSNLPNLPQKMTGVGATEMSGLKIISDDVPRPNSSKVLTFNDTGHESLHYLINV